MTTQSPSILEQLLRDNDLGWMIDMYAPREDAIPFLLDQLARLTATFEQRFGYSQSFAPDALLVEAERNPQKVRAFLQALGATRNPDMVLMAWRIIQGLRIREVEMSYRELDSFTLSVTLARPASEGDELESYTSDDIGDAALLRQFGIATVDGRPLFDGFYPTRKR